jgi:hypothetical protein
MVEAGVAVAVGVCSLIEGVDESGTVRNICATVEEIATIVQFVLTLRTTPDAGPSGACAVLPGSSLCVSSAERAKGILFVARVRERRLMLDAGR